MSEKKRYSPISFLLLAVLLLAACSDDSEKEPRAELKKVTIVPYYAPFLHVEPITRSLPDGYTLYSNLYPSTMAAHASIGLILTPDKTSVSGNSVEYVNDNGEWKWKTAVGGGISIDQGKTYYIYGFMPSQYADGASVTPIGTSSDPGNGFSKGATLTITDLDTLTPADVCVVVGVAKGTEDNDITTTGAISVGQFRYEGGGTEKMYLLLDHLYTGLHFKMRIDEAYAKLRTIKVREVELYARDDIYPKVNLTVNLTANDTGTNPLGTVNIEGVGTPGQGHKIQLFPVDDRTEFVVPVETPQDFLSCFAPGKCRQFELKTTYDVYDNNGEGNLIRKNCVAWNKINTTKFSSSDLSAGEVYSINLKIQPTFLYVLSDPDLDNPTITVEGGS